MTQIIARKGYSGRVCCCSLVTKWKHSWGKKKISYLWNKERKYKTNEYVFDWWLIFKMTNLKTENKDKQKWVSLWTDTQFIILYHFSLCGQLNPVTSRDKSLLRLFHPATRCATINTQQFPMRLSGFSPPSLLHNPHRCCRHSVVWERVFNTRWICAYLSQNRIYS